LCAICAHNVKSGSANGKALAATASATELTPTPLAAALSQSGIRLPIPFLDLSAQVICDLPLEKVSALQRFIAEAKSELATLAGMVQTGLEMRYADEARAQLLAKIEATGGDPREYIEIKYSVSEAKFKAWPQALRAL